MDTRCDQPLLESNLRQPTFTCETKEFEYSEPSKMDQIEHIELRDAELPMNSMDAGQGETIEVTKTETTTTTHDGKKAKKVKTAKAKKECQPLTVGLNVWDRDEKSINGHVHIMFEDVMAEPDGSHGFEPIWRGTFVCFNYAKLWIYRFLVAIIGLPMAFIWGLLFALASVFNNYFFTPFFKIFALVFFWIGRLWGTLFHELLDPVFESIGRCFSGIRYSRTEYCNAATNTGKTVTHPNGDISIA